MQVQYINLAKRGDRNEFFIGQSQKQGFEINRWEAEVSPYKIQNGISRSHKKVVRWAKNTGKEMVCIAEDDCLFTSPNGWKYFIENLPSDFDLYLGGLSTGELTEESTVRDFSGLHLYVVHSRFYDTFLSVPEHKDIDRALAGLGRFVVCSPMVAIQRNDYSDHQKKYQDYSKYWEKYEFLKD